MLHLFSRGAYTNQGEGSLKTKKTQKLMNDRETDELYHMMVNEYTPSVYKYFCSCRLSPVEAEDLTQETFLEAWKSLPGFRRESSPKTWLIKISRRIVWRYIKNRKKKQELTTSFNNEHVEGEAF